MKILLASKVRDLDRKAVVECGAGSLDLMERAGTGLYDFIRRYLGAATKAETWIFSGKGNNGGDGFVLARKLAENKMPVRLFLAFAPEDLSSKDAQAMYQKLLPYRVQTLRVKGAAELEQLNAENCGLVVDALLGTGVSGAAQGIVAEMIRWINAREKPVVAVDIPSGLDADLGKAGNPTVKADVTVTMALPKRGLFLLNGPELAGKIHVVDIGIPKKLVDAETTDLEAVSPEMLPNLRRKFDTNKGTYGHVLVLGGSAAMVGAPCLCALGALRSGCGLLTVACAQTIQPVVAAKLTESMTMGLEEAQPGCAGAAALERLMAFMKHCSAAIVGCGLGGHEQTVKLVRELVSEICIPLVLDADGINAFDAKPELLSKHKGPVIITPHPGELARLAGKTTAQIQKDRIAAAKAAARKHNVFVCLKGWQTVLACPEGDTCWINLTGNPGMATGGTGDVLAGVIGSLLAQGLGALEAMQAGVYLHGLAADLFAIDHGENGLIAGDLPDYLPRAVETLVRKSRRNLAQL